MKSAQPSGVLVAVAHGSESLETVTLVNLLRRAELEVTLASIEPELAIAGTRGIRLTADRRLIDARDHAARAFDQLHRRPRLRACLDPLVDQQHAPAHHGLGQLLGRRVGDRAGVDQPAAPQQGRNFPFGAHKSVKPVSIGEQQARPHGAHPAQTAAVMRGVIDFEIKPQPTRETLGHLIELIACRARQLTRQALIHSAAHLGLKVEERVVAPRELAQADAVFLTNSLRFIRPVTALDREPGFPAAGLGSTSER